MSIKEWDDQLKNLLGDYKPDDLQPDWNDFSYQLDAHQELTEAGDNPSFDENLIESLKEYQVTGEVVGWERIQNTLNAADKKFDEDIRKRLAEFEPHYDPRTWPLFLQRLADANFLSAKLIAIKVIEVAAVILILLTVVNMGRMGKLPFDTPLYDNTSDELNRTPKGDVMADNSNDNFSNSSSLENQDQSVANKQSASSKSPGLQSNSSSQHHSKTRVPIYNSNSNHLQKPTTDISASSTTEIKAEPSDTEYTIVEQTAEPISVNEEMLALANTYSDEGATDYLSTSLSPIEYSSNSRIPKAKFVQQRKKTHAEFGILAQFDYNRLRMPEDRLISAGRWIVFPQQGLPSHGYGAGFTLALAHNRWAFESGLVYSSKTFKPGRKTAAGTAFDNGVIEFDEMGLQLITMPLQARYKVDNKGPLRFYALAGFGLNLIVHSNIDVSIKYNFPSLSFGQNPNNVPDLANTIKESNRISEHISDGAPFSTKSSVSANAGLGLEYCLTEHKILFLQTALQYQIPDLKFSNNNGKHIRSVSIQAGVRTPLGK